MDESNKKLSFIIPCYNSKRYLRECIDSLYTQDVSEDDYEIVAVNDCSTDNTKEILLEYQANHRNFIIIDHEYNKKQGGARNTGLEYARGEYIWYIDHDDFIRPNSLSHMLEIVKQNQLDFLQFHYTEVNEKSEFMNNIKTANMETEVVSGLEFVKSLGSDFLNLYNMSVWGRLYNRKFLLNGKYQFDEIGIFEDLEYSLRTLLFADKIKIIEEFPYCYRIHHDSTMSIFQRVIRGNLTYFSCIKSGLSLVKLGNDLKAKDIYVSQLIYEGGIWRVNSITKPVLFSTAHERHIFYSLLKENQDIEKLYELSNSFNYLLLRFPVLNSIILFFISPLLRKVRKMRAISK